MTSTSMLSSAIAAVLITLLQVRTVSPANAQAPASPASGAQAPARAPSGPEPPAVAATKVDINTADAKELMQVLKIDDKTAQLIIKNRKDGKYESPDDLVTRAVFSNKELKSIKDKITVGSAGK
jgi:DNA uptake protein ComE-like DNA-binding protein